MSGAQVTEADWALLRLLQPGPLSVEQVASRLGVTRSAVRSRLGRLEAQGLVQRQACQSRGPGRPAHQYELSTLGRNALRRVMPELAVALWQELRRSRSAVDQRGLLQRVAQAVAEELAGQVSGSTPQQRLESLARMLQARNIHAQVEPSAGGQLPVLTVHDCPYGALAEQDRSICALERMALAQVVQSPLRLSECRFQGRSYCQFQPGC